VEKPSLSGSCCRERGGLVHHQLDRLEGADQGSARWITSINILHRRGLPADAAVIDLVFQERLDRRTRAQRVN
jgi:hypothetical protein